LLANIHNLEQFDADLAYMLSDRLSIWDVAKEPEAAYQGFLSGLLLAGQARGKYEKLLTNRESRIGRYDIMYRGEDFTVIFELKKEKNQDKLDSAVDKALTQIDDKRYYLEAPRDKPLIKTGIASVASVAKYVQQCMSFRLFGYPFRGTRS